MFQFQVEFADIGNAAAQLSPKARKIIRCKDLQSPICLEYKNLLAIQGRAYNSCGDYIEVSCDFGLV